MCSLRLENNLLTIERGSLRFDIKENTIIEAFVRFRFASVAITTDVIWLARVYSENFDLVSLSLINPVWEVDLRTRKTILILKTTANNRHFCVLCACWICTKKLSTHAEHVLKKCIYCTHAEHVLKLFGTQSACTYKNFQIRDLWVNAESVSKKMYSHAEHAHKICPSMRSMHYRFVCTCWASFNSDAGSSGDASNKQQQGWQQ